MKRQILTNTVIFLAHRVSSIASENFSAELEKEGITLWTWRVLASLLEDEDRRLSDLADAIRTEISTLSRLIASMEKQQLITRRYRTGDDGRALSIHLTPKGRALAERILPTYDAIGASYMRDISKQEQEVLRRGLIKIYDNIVSTSAPDEKPHAAPKRRTASPTRRG
jgi:MarR family transcriptional regulator, organic hydroperoxide resistance regulator